MTTTLFTWGYYGWGNCPRRFVEAVDAVEASRGFRPPMFVDVRISRSVRAVGFNGSRFEKLLGPDRYRWLKALGNVWIVSGKGPAIQIADPTAVNTLLDLATESAGQNRRVIFYCGCRWPRCDGKVSCHRAAIAALCVAAAKRQKQRIEVVEWPGGEAAGFDLDVSADVLASVAKGQMSAPLRKPVKLAEVASTPWCSPVTFRSRGVTCHRLVGPAFQHKGVWALPVFPQMFDPAADLGGFALDAGRLRKKLGLNSLLS